MSEIFLISLELASLLLILIFLITVSKSLLSLSIFRSKAVLEISDGHMISNVDLLTLPLCPSVYSKTLPSWISQIHIKRIGFVSYQLNIIWDNFYVLNQDNAEAIHFPKTITVGLLKGLVIKKLMKSENFLVNVKFIHGGRAIYLARDTGSETNQTVSNRSKPNKPKRSRPLSKPTIENDLSEID